jgi:hypothetical protein
MTHAEITTKRFGMGWAAYALVVAIGITPGCDDGKPSVTGATDGGGVGNNAGTGGAGGTMGTIGVVRDHNSCGMDYPSQPCDGNPEGKWTLAGMCINRYQDCAGAKVTTTGMAAATLSFTFDLNYPEVAYEYDYDIEYRLNVPVSCLKGGSCESIDCFGKDQCSCVNGSSSGGFSSSTWMPTFGTEVVTTNNGQSKLQMRFCAHKNTADSMIDGRRLLWTRVCTEGMSCRPADPCHTGKSHCAKDELTCEDTGNLLQRGTVCGPDKVCDLAGACVPCKAGASCEFPGQPCKAGVISCRNANPECVVKADVADGTSCGTKRACVKGACIAEDGEACTSDKECRDSCTCGDENCATKYCGRSCPCGWAPPGAQACSGFLADGTQDPNSCNKACFKGRCLLEVGQRCTGDNTCGSGRCTCWLSNCSGGRLCSIPDCPCQWAQSGAATCGGPLMDGLQDDSCQASQMCVQGACQ